MTENEDTTPGRDASRRLGELARAAAFLTRLPMRLSAAAAAAPLAEAAWGFPVVGLGVGFAGAVVLAVGTALGLSAWLAATAAVAAQVVLTGALHEDALADLADGLGGGADRDAKLAIMRDSRIGSYGVIALVLALAARIGALAALAGAGGGFAALIVAGAASRAAVVWIMRALPPARSDGLGRAAGRPDTDRVAVAVAIAAVAALLLLGFGGGVAALVAAGVGAGLVAAIARRQLGGQTGDVLGAAQQAGEILSLAVLAAA